MNRNYDNLIDQAAVLAKTLKEKGFNNLFLFRPSGMIADIDNGLKGLATIWKFSDIREIPRLNLTSCTYRNEGKNTINCEFGIDFNHETGFKITDLSILNSNAKGLTIDTEHLKIQSNDQIPTKQQANFLVTPENFVKKMIRTNTQKI